VNDELRGMRKEGIMTISRYSPGYTKDIYET
jgi:hypothetical protein